MVISRGGHWSGISVCRLGSRLEGHLFTLASPGWDRVDRGAPGPQEGVGAQKWLCTEWKREGDLSSPGAAAGARCSEAAGRWSEHRCPSVPPNPGPPARVRALGPPGQPGERRAGRPGGAGGLVRGYYNFTPFKRKTMPGIWGGGERSPGGEDVTRARRGPSSGVPRAGTARTGRAHPSALTPPLPTAPSRAGRTPPLPPAPPRGQGCAAGGAALGLFWASPRSAPGTCGLAHGWLRRRQRGVPRRPRAQRARPP